MRAECVGAGHVEGALAKIVTTLSDPSRETSG